MREASKTFTITHAISDKHIEQIYRNRKNDSLIGEGYRPFVDRIRQYETLGPSFSAATDAGNIIAMGGILESTPGVGHVWMALSTEALRRPKSLVKICRTLFVELKNGLNLHRLQADIDIHEWANIRFAERYDFNFEGVMKAYGPNKEDFYRYAWVEGIPGNRKLTKLMKKQKKKV